MKRIKKLSAIFIGLLCIGSIALAGWLISVNNSITGNVVSMNGESILVFDKQFDNWDQLNTTVSNASSSKIVTLINNNGGFDNMLVTIDKTFIDINDSCTPDPDECIITFELNNKTIETGDLVSIGSGANYLEATLSCERLACPSTANAQITISE